MVKLEPVDDDRHHFLSGGVDSDVRALREVGYGFRLGRREQSLADDTVGIKEQGVTCAEDECHVALKTRDREVEIIPEEQEALTVRMTICQTQAGILGIADIIVCFPELLADS